MKLLIDTNAYSALMRGNEKIARHLEEAEIAERFALIKAALRQKGRPIPVNDIWLAAQCLETGARILTLDTHFKEAEGLLLV